MGGTYQLSFPDGLYQFISWAKPGIGNFSGGEKMGLEFFIRNLTHRFVEWSPTSASAKKANRKLEFDVQLKLTMPRTGYYQNDMWFRIVTSWDGHDIYGDWSLLKHYNEWYRASYPHGVSAAQSRTTDVVHGVQGASVDQSKLSFRVDIMSWNHPKQPAWARYDCPNEENAWHDIFTFETPQLLQQITLTDLSAVPSKQTAKVNFTVTGSVPPEFPKDIPLYPATEAEYKAHEQFYDEFRQSYFDYYVYASGFDYRLLPNPKPKDYPENQPENQEE